MRKTVPGVRAALGSVGELSPEPPSPCLVALHSCASGLPRGAQVPMGPHSHGSGLSPAPRLPTGLPVGPTGRPGPGGNCGDRFSLGICQCTVLSFPCLGGGRAEPADAEDAGPPQGGRGREHKRPTRSPRLARSVESPEDKPARAWLRPRGAVLTGPLRPWCRAAPARPRNPWPEPSHRSRGEGAFGTLCAPSWDGQMKWGD